MKDLVWKYLYSMLFQRCLFFSLVKLDLKTDKATRMAVPLLQYRSTGSQPQRLGLKHPSIAPYGVFYSKDEKPILVSVQNQREWKTLCEKVCTLRCT